MQLNLFFFGSIGVLFIRYYGLETLTHGFDKKQL